jgi:histidinol-phosphate aminotransferase
VRVSDWSRFVRESLHDARPYEPGPRTDELEARYGRRLARLNRNEDLFPPIPGVREAVEAELANVWMYPHESYDDFRAAVARTIGTTADRIVPDFDALAATAAACRAKVVWVCDPNNPTGSLATRAEWNDFMDALPESCVAIVDEAYADYVEPASRLARERDVEAGRRVVVLRTLSKLFGIAGLRLGYAVVDPQVARYLDVVQEPFNVNRAAIAAGLACLARPELIAERRRAVAEARDVLYARLRSAGLEPVPAQTNFVLVDTGGDDAAIAGALAREGLLVRAGAEWGLDGYIRITVGPVPLMEQVADALERTLAR